MTTYPRKIKEVQADLDELNKGIATPEIAFRYLTPKLQQTIFQQAAINAGTTLEMLHADLTAKLPAKAKEHLCSPIQLRLN